MCYQGTLILLCDCLPFCLHELFLQHQKVMFKLYVLQTFLKWSKIIVMFLVGYGFSECLHV